MAFTLPDPSYDMALVLNGSTIEDITLTIGKNLFSGIFHPNPITPSVTLIESGGLPPEPYLTPSKRAYFRVNVQVLIHSMAGKTGYTQGVLLAKGVFAALQQVAISGYTSVVARDGFPVFLGQDKDNGQLAWSINFSAEFSGS